MRAAGRASWRLWLAGLLLAALQAVAAQPALPPYRVVQDLTGTLQPGERTRVEQAVAALDRATGVQLAVLIVATTGDSSVEEYAHRVLNAWKLGRKGVDDGVLILVAKNDRRARIEVGYGLEGLLPDARASRILREVMMPAFQKGDFAGGLLGAVARISEVLEARPASDRGRAAPR